MGKFSFLSQLVTPSKAFWRLKYIAQVKVFINSAFTKYLLLTNVSVSMALSGFGDILQQQYMLSKKPVTEIQPSPARLYDVVRTTNMTMSGATVGTLCHYWYQVLDRAFPGRSLKVIMKKLTVDQVIFSPVCLCVFLSTLAVSRRATKTMKKSFMAPDIAAMDSGPKYSLSQELHSFAEELRHKGTLLYVTEWIVWPPAQFINFYFLPTRFRVLYDNTVSLLYDAGSSYVCNDMAIEDVQFLANRASLLVSGTTSSFSNPPTTEPSSISENQTNDAKRSIAQCSNCLLRDNHS